MDAIYRSSLTLYCLISEKISSDKTEPGTEQGTAVDTVGNVSRLVAHFFSYFQELLTRFLNFFETGLVLLNPKLENFFFSISRTLALTEWKMNF
jgi:hypothetical protein